MAEGVGRWQMERNEESPGTQSGGTFRNTGVPPAPLHAHIHDFKKIVKAKMFLARKEEGGR